MARQPVIESLVQTVRHSVTQSLSHQTVSHCLTSQAVSQSLAWTARPCMHGHKTVIDLVIQPVSQSVIQSVCQFIGQQTVSVWLAMQSVSPCVFGNAATQ